MNHQFEPILSTAHTLAVVCGIMW